MNSSIGTLRALRILFGYRGRLLEGVGQDVRQRFVGSVAGSFWTVLLPLLQLCVYAGLYTLIFRIRPQGLTEMGYVLLVFSGMVPLMAFNEGLSAATTSLSSNRNLLLNTVFPAELIPLRALIAAQVPSLAGLGLVMLLGFGLGRTGWQALVLVPVMWMLLLMLAMGVGWVLSLLALVARDVQHGLAPVLMLLFMLSPFAYTPEMVPPALKVIIYLNPLSYFVLSFQQLICYGSWPAVSLVTCAALLSGALFVAGFTVFRRAKHVFFDYV
jgi:lipopolysaccharide transport system permease protein